MKKLFCALTAAALLLSGACGLPADEAASPAPETMTVYRVSAEDAPGP